MPETFLPNSSKEQFFSEPDAYSHQEEAANHHSNNPLAVFFAYLFAGGLLIKLASVAHMADRLPVLEYSLIGVWAIGGIYLLYRAISYRLISSPTQLH